MEPSWCQRGADPVVTEMRTARVAARSFMISGLNTARRKQDLVGDGEAQPQATGLPCATGLWVLGVEARLCQRWAPHASYPAYSRQDAPAAGKNIGCFCCCRGYTRVCGGCHRSTDAASSRYSWKVLRREPQRILPPPSRVEPGFYQVGAESARRWRVHDGIIVQSPAQHLSRI